MQNFIYHNPTKVIFGKDSIGKLSTVLPNAKILLIYGGGSIKQNGIYQQVVEQLEGHSWCEFSGVEANPEYETLMRAVSMVKNENVDYILAVGGGSVIDGAKFVAAATDFEGDAWDILAKGAKVKSAKPLGCILTLPATGTETNTSSVVTRREYNLKLPFMSDHVRPQFAILDPQATYSLPTRQLTNGIVDAFVHVMEQYLTYPVNASVQDRFAEAILNNLIEIGPLVLESKDYDLRANLMWNATQALSGLIGVGVPQDWSTHMIGHELTALHNLDHAVTLGIILPRVMQYQKEHKREKLLQYAERVWGLSRYDEEGAMDLAIEKTEQFFRDMGIKTKLSEHNIEADVADKIASRLEQAGMTKLGERQNITPKDVKQIVSASF
ncbi:iron-containing alcohol dehydrogenase [Aliiglaciecola lipolytica]|uniref:Probable NADH-dependent butanol dehydrogenase 2 n=1 Tax=Aliiglaciecola lipolytica E3 TaxID=1127673 RepID=K6XQU1_9ALTE|nr:iron-containing alcohol dehydrogenase [Aliiglaciecola lipolytica]GAC14061.1 probable NADH-dependent butanol dehydrogenase 2 [Aliiglaciecola lipolytica E3]